MACRQRAGLDGKPEYVNMDAIKCDVLRQATILIMLARIVC